MSVPNIPNITPKICLKDDDVINLMLSSIALEEISLSHIMDAESQKLISYIEHHTCNPDYFDEICIINRSIDSVLDKVQSIESLLVSKVKMLSEMQMYSKKTKNMKNNKKCSKNSCESDINTFSSKNCKFTFGKDKC